MGPINTIEPEKEKAGIGKIIAGIVIILVILAVIFVTYKYVAQDNNTDDIDTSDEGDDIGNGGDDILDGESEDEKPPRPPE
jgi:hypothetical protein